MGNGFQGSKRNKAEFSFSKIAERKKRTFWNLFSMSVSYNMHIQAPLISTVFFSVALLIIPNAPIIPEGKRILTVYDDRGDGTILDLRNGRLWQKCSFGQRFNGITCTGSPALIERVSAKRYCGELKSAKRRWRIPAIHELKEISRNDGKVPSLDLQFFSGSAPYEYWSSDTFIEGDGAMYRIYSFSRDYSFSIPSGSFLLRCVSE